MGALEGLVNAGASMEKSPESDIYLPFAFVNVDGPNRMVNFSPLREVDQFHAKKEADFSKELADSPAIRPSPPGHLHGTERQGRR
jgi:hypothetical protein